MTQVIIRGFLGRKLRSFLTALAIILGVAMIVGSSVLTAQIKGAFDGIFLEARKGTDVVVTKKATFNERPGPDHRPVRRVGRRPGEGRRRRPAGGRLRQLRQRRPDHRSRRHHAEADQAVAAARRPSATRSRRRRSTRPPSSRAGSRRRRTRSRSSRARRTRARSRSATQIALATSTGVHPVKVVGIYKFAGSTGGATQVIVDLRGRPAVVRARGPGRRGRRAGGRAACRRPNCATRSRRRCPATRCARASSRRSRSRRTSAASSTSSATC